MKRHLAPSPDATAAEWFVALETSTADEIRDALFAAWLDRAAENEPDLERCEAAMEIARRLADDPDLRWAYDEAAALAARDHTHDSRTWALLPGFARVRLVWGAAAILLVAVLASLSLPHIRAPSRDTTTVTALDPMSNAARIIAFAAASEPTIMLPGRVVVDANSVAVLPFLDSSDDSAPRTNVAAELHRDLVSALRAVPGVYVIDERSVSPYATADEPPWEIGAQLGARALLDADVAWTPDRIFVTARLTDAATGSPLWQEQFDAPLARLHSIQTPAVDGIAAALVDPKLRVRSARGLSQAKAPNVLAATAAEIASQ